MAPRKHVFNYGIIFLEKFNIEKTDLTGLADQMAAAGKGFLPYELYPGTGSDHGIDLVELANSGLGTAYDWRVDKKSDILNIIF